MSVNALEMSDDEFLNTPFDAFGDEPSATEETTEEFDTADDKTDDVDTVEETTEEEFEEDTNTSDDTETDEPSDETSVDENKTEKGNNESETVEETNKETTLNVQAELDKLFKPFKANGKEIKVNSVDEAIQLMQMGANYTKKMTALKPVMKVARMLENNGLMDESQVSFLIDLSKKDPNAIAKLLKESDINPLEIDLDKSVDYKGGNHLIDETQLKVEEVLESIKETPTYSRTINIVSKEWDDSSREVLASNPEIIADINQHMQSGIFDMIQQEMERQRIFGGLKGLSDIAAYKAVGDMLNAQGKFDKSPDQSSNQSQEVKPETNSNPDPKIRAKKQAAGLTKETKVASTKPDANFNPLAMSDEEFEKMFGNKL